MLFPKFWLKPQYKHSILSYILYPLSIVWLGLSKLRAKLSSGTKCLIPVICVGNITIGGNGKTPTALKLRSLLKSLGFEPHIISRGYKAQLKGPHLVNTKIDTFATVGDEAIMMGHYGPTWISRNRNSGAKSAIALGADIIILDDGLQEHSLKKDFSILVVDTYVGFGNGFLIPAGPLRERVEDGLKKVDLILIVGETVEQEAFEKDFLQSKQIPVVRGKLVPETNLLDLKDKKVIAFAGIGHPKKFRDTLNTMGANIISFKSFPNHKALKPKYLRTAIAEATSKKAILITTEKDFVRIPRSLRCHFKVVKVKLHFENQHIVIQNLMSALKLTTPKIC